MIANSTICYHWYEGGGGGMITNSTICCHWCGISLANASCITYLNGNLPCCDLCLMKAKQQNGTR